MAVLRIVRDKQTKEVKKMSESPAVVLEVGDDDEYVELEDMTHWGVIEEAQKKAGVSPKETLGKIYIHDDKRIEASAAVIAPIPTIAGEIRKNRAKNKKTADAPITLEEIEAAERAINGK